MCIGTALSLNLGSVAKKEGTAACNANTNLATKELTSAGTNIVAAKVSRSFTWFSSSCTRRTAISQTAQKSLQGAEGSVIKANIQVGKDSQWIFPKNPNDLLKDLPRDAKGRIYTSDNLRIRPEQHALKAGEAFHPRHHGQHYHIESKRNSNISWQNKKNIEVLKPPGYSSGSGTGFLPGEFFPS